MIPETNGTKAVFKSENGHVGRVPVVAWNAWEDGASALIAGSDGELVTARSQPGFLRLEASGLFPQMLSLIPGGGWIATFEDGYEAPVVAWALRDDFDVVPLVEIDGEAMPNDNVLTPSFTVRHPNEVEPVGTDGAAA